MCDYTRESKHLEFKQTITNTFLKTVSAFANYEGGKIIFGIDDNGSIITLPNPKEICLEIENKINDNISPQPDYSLTIEKDTTITLYVKSGTAKPYLYKSKAYKRNDTATIEVDSLEFSRLTLEGKNINFESLISTDQKLSFKTLTQKLSQAIQLSEFTFDTIKTLNLYVNEKGFNNAAALLSDINTFPGIDIAKFGDNINIIQKRKTISNCSILECFDSTFDFFKDFYTYEKIENKTRQIIEKIPSAAFREAIANALIHRTWDVQSQIRVLMLDDKIEIVSPGGLPPGISSDEYLNGRISVLRNPIIANIFFRLGIVEIFGTGILRIKQIYTKSYSKPEFEISENSIKITLPIITENYDLSEDEYKVANTLSKSTLKSISEIAKMLPFGKSKVTILLQQMAKRGIVEISGIGRATKYKLR